MMNSTVSGVARCIGRGGVVCLMNKCVGNAVGRTLGHENGEHSRRGYLTISGHAALCLVLRRTQQ